jgi:hypothetical protein
MTQPTTMRPNPVPTSHKILLRYDFTAGTMELADNGKLLADRRIPLQIGDTLEFSSPDGTVDIELVPADVFSTTSYTSGPPATEVVKVLAKPLPGTTCKIWCGIKGVAPASAHIAAYGSDPTFPN